MEKRGRKCGGDKNDIRMLEVGSSLTYPIERLDVVRNYAASLGLVLRRKYSTRADKDSGTITITRVE